MMHGGTGHAYTAAIREYLAGNPKELDPRKVMVKAKEAVQGAVEEKMTLLNTPRAAELS